MPEFPSLRESLGPPKPLQFPGIIVCDTCQDRPCWCCPVCGAALSICDDTCPEADQRPAEPRPDPALVAAVQVLTAHGVTATNYEELQAIATGRRRA